ncbi:MAG: hypothetical protein ACFE0P_08865 [Oceanicaulis sp.]
MRLVTGAGSAAVVAVVLGGCAGNFGYGKVLEPFPVTPQGVEEALALAREQAWPTIVIRRGLTDERSLHDPFLNEDGALCWTPSNAPERCYALSEIRRLYVQTWGYSNREAIGDAATAVLLSPALAAYTIIRANEEADRRRRRAAYEAERAAFAARFGGVLPQGLSIVDVCRIGPVEPDPPAPDACLVYWAAERERVWAEYVDNLIEGGWTRAAALEGRARLFRTGPDGAREDLTIERLTGEPDPTLINPSEIMVLRLSRD